MLHRLCGSPSIPLSFNLATILPRRNTYRVSYGTRVLRNPHTKYSSFRARTTGVSNPVCSPSFRASASVSVQQPTFVTGVPLDIYAFHRYTENSDCLSRTQSTQVSDTATRLSPVISRPTLRAAYAPFTPSKSEQRLPPTYYRGCWHVVSRGLHRIPSLCSSPAYELYIPKDFIVHAALLGQAFAHCPKFLTAASRRSLARVSVPVWPTALSGRLPIVALVGHYPTN